MGQGSSGVIPWRIITLPVGVEVGVGVGWGGGLNGHSSLGGNIFESFLKSL